MRQVAKYYVLSPKTQPFSPLDLSPALWLDASDTATITASLGSVSQWDDKSGNGLNFAQAVASQQPTTGTRTTNGLNVIDFDGSNDDLTIASFALSQPFTLFTVLEHDVDSNGRYFNSAGSPSTVAASHITVQVPFEFAAASVQGASGTAPINTTLLMRNTFNGASSAIHVDGVSVASGNAGASNISGGCTIGRTHASTTQPWNGVIAEMIVVPGVLTAGQISDMETYLTTKWGL